MLKKWDGGCKVAKQNQTSQKVPNEFDEFVKKAIINKIKLGVEEDKITKSELLLCIVKYFKSSDVSYTEFLKTKVNHGRT